MKKHSKPEEQPTMVKWNEKYDDSTGWEGVSGGPFAPPNISIACLVSPIFIEAARIRHERGLKYSAGGVQIEEHFPLGDKSYFQMCWTKTVRMKSMILSGSKSDALLDSILDCINYLCFWAEAIMKEKQS